MDPLIRVLQRAALSLTLIVAASALQAAEVRIAVAANFIDAATEIGTAFEAETGHRAVLSFASTGQLFTQIAAGAPFDVFLAADRDRPSRAVAEWLADPDHRVTYAYGRLVLYSREPGLVVGPETLAGDTVGRLAIANPATAPYGAAAVQVLERLGQWERYRPAVVRGTSIAQTYQFVATGNADLGFVSASQLAGRTGGQTGGSRWPVPDDLHDPIAQDAVLLTAAKNRDAALAFLAFLTGPRASAIVERFGYAPGR